MERAIERLADWIGAIVGLLFLALFIAHISNITLRYGFGLSYIWIPDLSRILFIWMVFLGGTTAYIKKQHLIIDFVKNKLRARALWASDALVNLAMAAFLVFLIIKGVRIASIRMNIPYDSWDAVPTAVAYAAVPVAGGIMLLATLARLVTASRRSDSPRDADGPGRSGDA